MTPHPHSALVFDLDGTLVDSAADIAGALNATLAEEGHAPLPVETIERFTGEGATILVARVLAAIGVEADAARVGALTGRYLAHYAASPCERSTLFADAAEALPRFRAAGIPLGVCTNKPEHLAVAVLAALGVAALFDAIVGADTTAARKPDPRPLLQTLGRLGAAPGRAVLVGDTAIDRETAERAGVPWRIVAWHRSPDLVVPESALLRRFADLDRDAGRSTRPDTPSLMP